MKAPLTDEIRLCQLKGYEADTAPFNCIVSPPGAAIDIHNPQLASVAQRFSSIVPRVVTCDVKAYQSQTRC